MKKKPLKKMKGRPRGGASYPCPECGHTTHVVLTRRVEGQVVRKRECLAHQHQFTTKEVA